MVEEELLQALGERAKAFALSEPRVEVGVTMMEEIAKYQFGEHIDMLKDRLFREWSEASGITDIQHVACLKDKLLRDAFRAMIEHHRKANLKP